MASHAAPDPSIDLPANVTRDQFVDFDLYDLTGYSDVGDVWTNVVAKGNGSLLWSPRHGGHWIATDGAAVKDILQDTARFSSRMTIVPPIDLTDLPPFLPIMADPPQHGFYRSFINPFVTPKEIRAREASIRDRAVALLSGFADEGRCEFMEDFARRLPPVVFLTLAGLPLEDAEILSSTSIVRIGNKDAIAGSMQRKIDYFLPLIRERIAEPRQDFISGVVNRELRGRKLTEQEALGIIMQFVGAGLDTVASLLGFVMLFLARNPDHRKRLVAEPALASKASTEFIRRFPIATVARYVAVDMQYRGADLKVGDIIVVPTALPNFDEQIYPDPFKVDFDRDAEAHYAFGAGTHRCPGAILAHSECRIVLEEWLRLIPDFELDAGDIRLKGGIVTTLEALPLRWS